MDAIGVCNRVMVFCEVVVKFRVLLKIRVERFVKLNERFTSTR